VPVGILIDKNFEKTDRVFIPVFHASDLYLIKYAQKLIHNAGSQITIIDAAGEVKNNTEIKEAIRAIEQNAPNHITIASDKTIEKEFLQTQDLMLISFDSWKKLIDSRNVWLNSSPTTLIIKP
jgi:pyruvate/2-oxoacid:ferredoxin oxidoreductase alpha subunit